MLLGDAGNVRAARSKAGPFEALRGFPEFRDLVVAVPAGPGAPPARPSTPRARRAAPAVAVSTAPAPHINLGGRPSDESPEWLKWSLLLLLAVASAVLALALFPHLK